MDLYHCLNRGVDGRPLFLDSQDYARFVHDLYEFNDTALSGTTHNLFNRKSRTGFVNPSSRKRELIVDIHGWCLMGNHYHLLLSERVEGGLRLFLRKLNVGYANYFNEKYERKGTLFQGRTKKILIERNAHFLYILHYIHLNPLDFLEGAEEWRERDSSSVADAGRALDHLDKYRWSSFLDYCGTKNFPSILTTEFFNGVFGDYRKTIMEFLRQRANEQDSDLRTRLGLNE